MFPYCLDTEILRLPQNTMLHGSVIARCGSKRTSSECGVPIRSSFRKTLEKRTEISPAVCQTRSDPKSFSRQDRRVWCAPKEPPETLKNAETEKIRLRGGYVARQKFNSVHLESVVPAGGIGIPKLIENTYVIEFSTRSKRSYIRNCARLERIWNPRIQELHEFSDAPPARAANPRISCWCYPVRNTSMNSRLLVCLSKMPRVQRPDARIISCPRHFRSSLATIRQSWSQRGSESRNGPNTDASLNAFRRRLSEFGKGQSHSKAFCPPHTSENWWVQ
jgi:hypothetical protein